MSFYPIEIDKERSFRFNMIAISKIEKHFKKPIMKIAGMQDGSLTMDDYAYLFCAGLKHEDEDLTPSKVIDLIAEHSTVGKVSGVFWKAFNEEFKTGTEEEQKAEILIKLQTGLESGMIAQEEILAVLNSGEVEEIKND